MQMNDTELERMFIQMGNRKQVTKEERYLNLIEYFPKVEKEVKKTGGYPVYDVGEIQKAAP